jgi:hypothetical protein
VAEDMHLCGSFWYLLTCTFAIMNKCARMSTLVEQVLSLDSLNCYLSDFFRYASWT